MAQNIFNKPVYSKLEYLVDLYTLDLNLPVHRKSSLFLETDQTSQQR
jgi:hypothetical protein